MKKSLLVLALLGAFAELAAAQSSVTLFGVVDLSAAQIDNKTTGGVSTKVRQLRTDGISSSRFGVRGIEDLGNDLKAGFWLEAGLAADTGVVGASNGNSNPVGGTGGSTFFNRRSTASLLGNFGEIRLGRDWTPTYLNVNLYDPFGAVGIGQITDLVNVLGSGVTNFNRANNSVQYFLPPNLGGIFGNVMMAAGEGAVGNKYQGGRIGYEGGPFNVAVAYSQNLSTTSEKYKLASLGGFWKITDMFKLTAQYNQGKYLDVAGRNLKQALWQVGTIVTFGQNEIHAAFNDANMSGGAANTPFADISDAKQWSVGYVYNLSKRTALYGTASRINNKGGLGGAAYVVGFSSTNPSSWSLGSSAGGSSTGIEAGVRHSF
jgi:predicted porin